MPDKNLTDNEIVKALIVVIENKRMTTEYLINVTIDRINSLTADVFRQQAEINVKNRLLDEQKAEIERLKATVDSFNDIGKLYSEIKAEAYREFADKLKKEINVRTTFSKEQDKNVLIYIDNLLKELVGDNDG